MSQVINILNVMHLSPYVLRLNFNDRTEKDVDFEPFLRQSKHPDIQAYLAPEKFCAFRLEHGELVWGDWELCFPIVDLHRGEVSRPMATQAAA
jgi:hypothetical protein